ncbi:ATP-binding protein [Aggregatibacter actinomycetemcomitans]|uniref:ATP-binding protein n=1 Tax=Aggregatibacter actinomycetemcomitans TaxID=714 RepID=UPI00215157C5|nr:ATP-binding protein [Aggregatibacter actinomycetemcomitans]
MLTEPKTFEVDVSPEMRLYKILQKQSYEIETALAEFLDNSIQSFIDYKGTHKITQKEDLLLFKIEIDSKNKKITITDNAFGINRENFQRAIRVGHRSGFSHGKDSLSVYGIGLKSSAIWFSDTWSIETTAIGHGEKLTAEFDLNNLLATGQQCIVVNSEPCEEREHYTKISILNSMRNLPEEYYRDTVLPYLQETFYKFPFLKLEIIYDNLVLHTDKAHVSTPAPLISPIVDRNHQFSGDNVVWKKLIDLDYAGRQVKGFIMIMDKGGYKQPGIRLFRNNRVINGTSAKRNVPNSLYQTSNKYSAQRIYGELHLDDFPVNFMKTGFDENLDGLYRLLHSELKGNGREPDFLAQAENYRAKQDKRSTKERMTAEQNEKNALVTDNSGNTKLSSDNSIKNKKSSNVTVSSEKNPPIPEKMPENIEYSKKVCEALDSLETKKLRRFYDSLCRISLTKDPLLAYVCAWSFFESLKSYLKKEANTTDFPSFFNQYIINIVENKVDRKPYTQALSEIHVKGNLCKHDGNYETINAQQLAVDFKLLENLILKVIKINV